MDYSEIVNWQKIPEFAGLFDLATPPKKIYVCGNFNPKILTSCVAIVGSRKMTDYGARSIEKIVPALVLQGKTIVSGFMYGVDMCAHKICIEMGGKTIAVLGWGVASKLSGEDAKLARQITDNGGILLSEWEFQKASHWTFPARNRIIAALSQEVIVVEAAEKSGSLITAKIAAKLKRTLWAVPGPITSRTSEGTNSLIAKGQARVWLGPQIPGRQIDDPILAILDMEALTADELCRKLNISIADLGAKLSLLLLSGQIIEKGGKYYLTDAS